MEGIQRWIGVGQSPIWRDVGISRPDGIWERHCACREEATLNAGNGTKAAVTGVMTDAGNMACEKRYKALGDEALSGFGQPGPAKAHEYDMAVEICKCNGKEMRVGIGGRAALGLACSLTTQSLHYLPLCIPDDKMSKPAVTGGS